jgi:nicotinamidase-related amidase
VKRLSPYVDLFVVSVETPQTVEYLQPAKFRSALRDFAGRFYCVTKTTNDVWRLGEFAAFIRAKVESGLRLLIVTGCTTTCCVRESAISIAQSFPTLQVCVVLVHRQGRQHKTQQHHGHLASVRLVIQRSAFGSQLDCTIRDLS